MKRLCKYLVGLCFILAFASCDKDIAYPVGKLSVKLQDSAMVDYGDSLLIKCEIPSGLPYHYHWTINNDTDIYQGNFYYKFPALGIYHAKLKVYNYERTDSAEGEMTIEVVKGRYLTHVVIRQFPVLNPATRMPWGGKGHLPWLYFSAERFYGRKWSKETTDGVEKATKDSLPIVLRFRDPLRIWTRSFYSFSLEDYQYSPNFEVLFQQGTNDFPYAPRPWVLKKDSFIIELHSEILR